MYLNQMIRALLLSITLSLGATAGRACEIALVLAIDVSGSVDRSEYKIQRDGLAQALRDPVVSEALVGNRAQVMVLQWTGSGRQRVTVPWTEIADFDALFKFADQVAADKRAWRNYSTAIGEALVYAAEQFQAVSHCTRHVIDVSGDGRSNEGFSPSTARDVLRANKITVNALVIEGAEDDLTGYFWENVIYGEGAFVATANDFHDYPERIRQKLRRETTKQTALNME